MSPVEIEETLETLTVLVDSREQDTERSRRRLKAMGAPAVRVTLDFGDYAANVRLPSGEWLHDPDGRIAAKCVIERKMNLDELAECLTRGRDRFRREFQRAREHGANVWLLVENGGWEALLAGRYRSKFQPKAFLASLTAWAVRYDLHIVFCDELTTPILIREILYRDMKERLSNGEFDKDGWTDRMD